MKRSQYGRNMHSLLSPFQKEKHTYSTLSYLLSRRWCYCCYDKLKKNHLFQSSRKPHYYHTFFWSWLHRIEIKSAKSFNLYNIQYVWMLNVAVNWVLDLLNCLWQKKADISRHFYISFTYGTMKGQLLPSGAHNKMQIYSIFVVMLTHPTFILSIVKPTIITGTHSVGL